MTSVPDKAEVLRARRAKAKRRAPLRLDVVVAGRPAPRKEPTWPLLAAAALLAGAGVACLGAVVLGPGPAPGDAAVVRLNR